MTDNAALATPPEPKPRAKSPIPHSDTRKKEIVVVLGMGNFGTCLADHLADIGHSVIMWGRDQNVVDSINNKHVNSKYLGDVGVLLKTRLG